MALVTVASIPRSAWIVDSVAKLMLLTKTHAVTKALAYVYTQLADLSTIKLNTSA
jgi:hypothetical protein